MAYLQSIGGQVGLFLRAIGFGALLGVLYDIVRFLRLLIGRKSLQVFWDILFGAAAAVSTLLYNLIYSDGKLRLFIFAAQCAGFAVWYVLAAPTVRRIGERVLNGMQRCSAKIREPIIHIERVLTKKTQHGVGKLKKIPKKFQKNKKNT